MPFRLHPNTFSAWKTFLSIPQHIVLCCPQDFLPRLFRETHITALLQGNLTAEDAMEIASSVRAAFSAGIMSAAERPLDRVAMLPQTSSLLHRCHTPRIVLASVPIV